MEKSPQVRFNLATGIEAQVVTLRVIYCICSKTLTGVKFFRMGGSWCKYGGCSVNDVLWIKVNGDYVGMKITSSRKILSDLFLNSCLSDLFWILVILISSFLIYFLIYRSQYNPLNKVETEWRRLLPFFTKFELLFCRDSNLQRDFVFSLLVINVTLILEVLCTNLLPSVSTLLYFSLFTKHYT